MPVPEFPFLARYKILNKIDFRGIPLETYTILIPTRKSRNHYSLGNPINYAMHNGELIIALSIAWREAVFYLPLKPILEGVIPKNALIWERDRGRYPIVELNAINTDLDLC